MEYRLLQRLGPVLDESSRDCPAVVWVLMEAYDDTARPAAICSICKRRGFSYQCKARRPDIIWLFLMVLAMFWPVFWAKVWQPTSARQRTSLWVAVHPRPGSIGWIFVQYQVLKIMNLSMSVSNHKKDIGFLQKRSYNYFTSVDINVIQTVLQELFRAHCCASPSLISWYWF